MLKRNMPPSDPTLTLQEAADRLGVHYMTVYRYVRTGKLPATRDGMIWQIRTSDIEALEKGRPFSPGVRAAQRDMDAVRASLEARLLAGDGAGAWWLVEGRLGGGLDPFGVVTMLLSPALRSIGERWAKGELTVADEHRATAAAQRIIGRLGLQFGRPGRSRGTVILASPSGEQHTLPVAMVADLLRWRGFDVVELGANTPADALAKAVVDADRVVAVGVASTTSGLDAQVRRSIVAVRAVSPRATIVVGGNGIRDAGHARRLGADLWTGREGMNVVHAIEGLVKTASLETEDHVVER